MKFLKLMVILMAFCFFQFIHSRPIAQTVTKLSNNVVSNGISEIRNNSFSISGTFGQVVIGTVNNAQIVNETGFWYQNVGKDGPIIQLSKESLNFGEVVTGQSVSDSLKISNAGSNTLVFRVSVSGTDATVFSVSPDTFKVAAGDTVDVSVTFSPSSTGTKNASLNILHNAEGGSKIIELVGIGSEIPGGNPDGPPIFETSLGPIRELSWGTVARSETPERIDFKILNTGGAVLNVSNMRISGTLLMKLITEPRFEVPAGGEQVVVLELMPSVTGNIDATLTMTTDDDNNPSVSIDLTAEIRERRAQIFNLDDLSFDSVSLGMPSTDDVTVQNRGGLADLKIFDVESDNPQVDITSFSTNPIRAEETSLIQASYTPRAFQARSGIIYVYSNAEENPKRIPWNAAEVQVDTLSLTGTLPANGEPNAGVNTITLDFSEDVLDLGRRFAPVVVDLYPEPLNADWHSEVLVVGSRVIYQDVQLEPGRSYRLSVLEATGSRGQDLGTAQVILFSTGGSLAQTGTISGVTVLTSESTFEDDLGQMKTIVDTLNTQGGRVFAVDALTKAVVSEQIIGEGGNYELRHLPVLAGGDGGRYLLYAEVEGREQVLNVGFDRDLDGNLDPLELFSGGVLRNINFDVKDAPLLNEVTPGRISVDANAASENQNDLSAAYLTFKCKTSIALYADDVNGLKVFETLVQFDENQLDFVNFVGAFSESLSVESLTPEDFLFVGQKDGVSSVRPRPDTRQNQTGVIRITGKLLDAQDENVVNGSGLLGILEFAPKAESSSKRGTHLTKQAAAESVVTIGPFTLQSINRPARILDEIKLMVVAQHREDFDNNGDIGFGDFLLFAQNFGRNNIDASLSRFDLNGDRSIGFGDFLVFAISFGRLKCTA